jgi:hypothetical protein
LPEEIAWMEDALDALSTFGGPGMVQVRRRFQLMVARLPLPLARRRVLGGVSWRGGGAGVLVVTDRTKSASEYSADSILLHELIHHQIPHAPVGERWFTEGLATYYQWVLKGRAGQLSPRQVWGKLGWGFFRAFDDDTIAKRYWRGALVALRLDLEMRRRSGGRATLDDALVGLLPLAQSGRSLGSDVLLDLVLQHPLLAGLDRPPMWDPHWAREALKRLGIEELKGEIVLSQENRARRWRRQLFEDPGSAAGSPFSKMELNPSRPGP